MLPDQSEPDSSPLVVQGPDVPGLAQSAESLDPYVVNRLPVLKEYIHTDTHTHTYIYIGINLMSCPYIMQQQWYGVP
jgi:hypothetical protein